MPWEHSGSAPSPSTSLQLTRRDKRQPTSMAAATAESVSTNGDNKYNAVGDEDEVVDYSDTCLLLQGESNGLSSDSNASNSSKSRKQETRRQDRLAARALLKKNFILRTRGCARVCTILELLLPCLFFFLL